MNANTVYPVCNYGAVCQRVLFILLRLLLLYKREIEFEKEKEQKLLPLLAHFYFLFFPFLSFAPPLPDK